MSYRQDLDDMNGTVSNNVNGPGSGSLRVYRYVLQTWSTAAVNEVQVRHRQVGS